MKVKMVVCPACGKEIAANAKTCPACGAKIKKPFYKKGWFIALIIIFILGGIGSTVENDVPAGGESGQEIEIEYITCTIDEMEDLLTENALTAEEKYEGQYVEVTGELRTIDSDGSYIGVYALHNDFDFLGMTCYIKSDEQLEQVKKMSVGDKVTIRGKVTDVGEILGFMMNIVEIVE